MYLAHQDIKSNTASFRSFDEFAKFLNANLDYVHINFSAPKYNFSVLGKTDFEKSSFEFIGKPDGLYIKMNLPRNNTCDYGLKIEKAKWTGSCGKGTDYINFTFKYEYQCDDNNYSTIYAFFNEGLKKYEEEIKKKLRESNK